MLSGTEEVDIVREGLELPTRTEDDSVGIQDHKEGLYVSVTHPTISITSMAKF
jgi:hypothetical protein